jgi:hypothetical protein
VLNWARPSSISWSSTFIALGIGFVTAIGCAILWFPLLQFIWCVRQEKGPGLKAQNFIASDSGG